MDHHHDHNYCRGNQLDRENNDEDNRQSECYRYSHRCGRQRVDDLSVVQTTLNQNDSIERYRARSCERWSPDETVGMPRGVYADDLTTTRRTTHPPRRPNRILLVHGLDRVPVNCDRVFNLFCLYGNVVAVKVLRDDKVLVEMDDWPAAERCVSNLHLLPLDDAGEWRLKVKYSKHSFIYDQMVFNKLPDGTPVQKNYSNSKLNRFTEMSSRQDRRRITSPSKILHFFNAPIDVCGYAVHKAVTDALGVADAIRSITILPKQPAAMCSTGLIELKTVALAAKTVLLANHTPLESKRSRFPFLTKLCFSKWSEIGLVTEPGAAASSLRLSYTSRSPWLLHESERAASATTFQIARTTTETGCCGDCPWTLWTASHDETPVPAAPSPSLPLTDAVEATVTSDVRSGLFDMLRLRLCPRDDRGDVPHDDPSPADNDAASAVVRHSADATVLQASGGDGPLGDA